MTDHRAHDHSHGQDHHPAPSIGDPRSRVPNEPHNARATARRDGPGLGGHDRHVGHSPEMFRRKFWRALVLTIPVVVWSGHIQELLGYTAPSFPASTRLPGLFGTMVFLYGGLIFLRGAWAELRGRLPGMMTLISLAITVAFSFSVVVELGLIDAEALWWESATLITIMLLGHWIEMRSISEASGALRELANLIPDTAHRLVDDAEQDVPVADLRAGDLVLVRPGENIPADGVVRKGRSEVSEAMITGESRPVGKEPGAQVIAGTINGSGSLRIEVTGTGDATKLSGIMRLVSDAQRSKSRVQHLADRAAQILTYVAIAAGTVTMIVWQLIGAPIDFSLTRVVTVLVISCPHALGLAVPLVVAISTTLGVHGGLLVRDRRGLEEARLLDIVIFDKTGTLTLGEFRVVDMAVAGGIGEDEALTIAAAIESESEHPIARGIVKTAAERKLSPPAVEDFRAIAGRGVEAKVGGMEYRIGGPALLEQLRAAVPTPLEEVAGRAASRGQAAIYLIAGSKPVAVFAIADAIREESRAAIDALHAAGIEVAMLTGDAEPVARAVAAELGIETVFSRVLPEDKASRVRSLQERGKKVAMVGDGVNDAPALATADIGIAIGAGTDVAVEAGHIVLVRSDPRDIPRIVALSRATYRKMIQNLWWAAGYNIVAIPLAAGVLSAWGILLTPAVGAILMSASTIVVAVNAQLLRRAEI